MASTHHTYPALLGRGGRLARTDWGYTPVAGAIAGTLRLDPQAIILVATDGEEVLRGYAPGGMAD